MICEWECGSLDDPGRFRMYAVATQKQRSGEMRDTPAQEVGAGEPDGLERLGPVLRHQVGRDVPAWWLCGVVVV